MTTNIEITPGLDGYSAQTLREQAGMSHRQLDYWCRENVLRPRIEANGSGTWRIFDAREIHVATAVRELMHLGAGTSVCRTVAETLRGWSDGELAGRVFVSRVGSVFREPSGSCWTVDLDALRPEL